MNLRVISNSFYDYGDAYEGKGGVAPKRILVPICLMKKTTKIGHSRAF